MADPLQDVKDEAMRRKMGKAYNEAPYLSMGTKPPVKGALKPAPKKLEPPQAVSPMEEPVPSALRELQDEKMRERMGRAYEEAAPRSMKRGYAKGGAVGSASKRADGIAQRGKTKGRIL